MKEENRSEEENEGEGKGPEPKKPEDVFKMKLVCSLAYIFGILFFLPLIMYPDDDFARFHANQSLAILLVVIVGEIIFGVLSVIPAVGVVFKALCGVFGLIMLVFCIFGIVGVVKEEKNELPFIGKIKLFK